MYVREPWPFVTPGRAARWLARVCGVLVCLWMALHADGAESRPGKRVLMVFMEAREVPANHLMEQAIRDRLQGFGDGDVEFYSEYLDANRFLNRRHYALFREFLREKYVVRRPDVVLAFVSWDFQLADVPAEELVPGVPAVFMAVGPMPVPVGGVGTNSTGIVARPDYAGTLEVIFRLQPDTRRIVVIGGMAGADRLLMTLARNASRTFAGRAELEFWTNRPLAELRSAVATLPPRTAMLVSGMFRDVAGRALFPAQAVELLAQTANAPIYVWADSQVGGGAVGGAVVRYDELGARAAEVAQRILQGARAVDLPITVVSNGTPLFDWRALQRWGISESRLPPGSVLRFRPPTLWEERKEYVIGGVVIIMAQAATIAALLLHRARRRRAEDAVRENEQRMALAAEYANLGIWVRDLVRNEVWATNKWRALLGFGDSERIELAGFLQKLHPEDRAGVRQIMEQAVAGLGSYDAEYRVVQPGGAVRWIASRGRVEFDSAGQPILVRGVSLDITERKQARENLTQIQKRHELILESAAEGILGLDAQGNHTFVNSAAARMLGYEAGELIGRHSHDLWHHTRPDGSPYPEAECKIYASCVDGKVHRESREVFWRKDGSSFAVEYASTPIYQQGQLLGAVVTFVDITVRKQNEAAVLDLSRRLIHAHEAERARLGRELHDDVTQRLAVLAIDVARVERDGGGVLAADTMRSVREGLVQLSEDIHALSYRLHPAVLEDLGLAEAVKAECERFTRQESIPAEVRLSRLPDALPRETALCLFRVAQEALRNVARHAHARRVEVSVRALDGGLQLAVIDDGVGFDPTLPRERPSLGLASMRERILLLGGELDIESAPGRGTTILVSLPLPKGGAEGGRA